MDNLHYRLTFDLDNDHEFPRKNLLKVVKFQNLEDIAFPIIVLRAEIVTIFEPKVVTISACITIIRKFVNIVRPYLSPLQHFSTKVWNFTTFERFFPGILFFFCLALSR